MNPESDFLRLSRSKSEELSVYTPEELAVSVSLALVREISRHFVNQNSSFLRIPISTLKSDAQEVGAQEISAFKQLLELLATQNIAALGKFIKVSRKESSILITRGFVEAKLVISGDHDLKMRFDFAFSPSDDPRDPTPSSAFKCIREWQNPKLLDTNEKKAYYDKLGELENQFKKSTALEMAYMFAILAEGINRSVV